METEYVTEYMRNMLADADRRKVILLLYEGSLNFLRMAKERMQRGDVEAKVYMGRVTSIITELSNVLDMENGGEFAMKLRSLYDYILQRLLYANLRNDVTILEEVDRLILELRDGWKEMMNTEI